jgi:hypothetical protein
MVLQGKATAYTELILRPTGEWQTYPGQIDTFLGTLIEFHGREVSIRFWVCTGPRNREEIGHITGRVDMGTLQGKEKALKRLLEACSGKEVMIEIKELEEANVVALPIPEVLVDAVAMEEPKGAVA